MLRLFYRSSIIFLAYSKKFVSLHRISNNNNMAIGYGLTGKVRGKIGSNVYRIDAGRQIISEYNPARTEIPTDAQIETRTRMTLATEVSRLFPFETIVGFSPRRAQARNDFQRVLMSAIGGEWTQPAKYVATLEPDRVELSKGAPVAVASTEILHPSISETSVQVKLATSRDSGVVRMLAVLLLKSNTTGQWVQAMHKVSAEKTPGNDLDVVFLLNPSQLTDTYSYYGYIVPMQLNTMAKRSVYSSLHVDASEAAFAADVMVTLKRADILGATIYAGSLDR